MITRQQLARVLGEALARDGWAPTETILLGNIAEPEPEHGNNDDVAAMRDTLDRVVAQLNTEE